MLTSAVLNENLKHLYYLSPLSSSQLLNLFKYWLTQFRVPSCYNPSIASASNLPVSNRLLSESLQEGIPGGTVIITPYSLLRTLVQSLVRELRFCKPCGGKKKIIYIYKIVKFGRESGCLDCGELVFHFLLKFTLSWPFLS